MAKKLLFTFIEAVKPEEKPIKLKELNINDLNYFVNKVKEAKSEEAKDAAWSKLLDMRY